MPPKTLAYLSNSQWNFTVFDVFFTVAQTYLVFLFMILQDEEFSKIVHLKIALQE